MIEGKLVNRNYTDKDGIKAVFNRSAGDGIVL